MRATYTTALAAVAALALGASPAPQALALPELLGQSTETLPKLLGQGENATYTGEATSIATTWETNRALRAYHVCAPGIIPLLTDVCVDHVFRTGCIYE
jgi:hypothetical protein